MKATTWGGKKEKDVDGVFPSVNHRKNEASIAFTSSGQRLEVTMTHAEFKYLAQVMLAMVNNEYTVGPENAQNGQKAGQG